MTLVVGRSLWILPAPIPTPSGNRCALIHPISISTPISISVPFPIILSLWGTLNLCYPLWLLFTILYGSYIPPNPLRENKRRVRGYYLSLWDPVFSMGNIISSSLIYLFFMSPSFLLGWEDKRRQRIVAIEEYRS